MMGYKKQRKNERIISFNKQVNIILLGTMIIFAFPAFAMEVMTDEQLDKIYAQGTFDPFLFMLGIKLGEDAQTLRAVESNINFPMQTGVATVSIVGFVEIPRPIQAITGPFQTAPRPTGFNDEMITRDISSVGSLGGGLGGGFGGGLGGF